MNEQICIAVSTYDTIEAKTINRTSLKDEGYI